MNIYEEVQEIFDSYRAFPTMRLASKSIVEEVATRVVDYVVLEGMTMDDFDFEDLFEKVNMGKWE